MSKRIYLAVLCCMAYMLPAPAFADPQAIASRFDEQLGLAKSSMMSDPLIALKHARHAAKAAEAMPEREAVIAKATSQWLEGEALTRMNQAKKADPIIQQALKTISRADPNSKLHADLLKSKAAIIGQIGKVENALAILHQAYGIYEKLDETRSQAIILHNIASIYYEARDYDRVLNYYDQAEKVHTDDPVLSLSAHNNLGNAYRDMGNFAKAEKEYQLALTIARDMQSLLLEARILNNLAYSQFAQKRYKIADKTAANGLEIARKGAADWMPYLWGTRAKIALERDQMAKAETFINLAMADIDPKTSQMEYRDHHQTAYQIFKKLGKSRKALVHLEAYKRLDDNGRSLAASTNSSLLAAQFDEANRELRISKLEAKQAQRDMALAESETKLRLAIVSLIATLVIIGALFAGIASIRGQRKKVSAANAQLSHAARHDLLTGLANRAYYRELLGNALKGASADGRQCAVILIDLDRFKAVNDTLGHDMGDKLLCKVAEILNSVAGDTGYAVRLGGDEFALVIPDISLSKDPMILGKNIIDRLNKIDKLRGVSVDIGATTGVAIGPDDGDSVSVLTRRADLALYQGKNKGRGHCVRYKAFMQMEANERHELEADLRLAMERGELSIAYQSIIDVRTGKIAAYEALLRWNHPTRGAISPDIFIPIAEEARLIGQIGSWVLRTSCAEAAKWPAHVRLSVNISALQVEGGGLANTIIGALAGSGLRPERLELEVTESVFLGKNVKVEQILDGLCSLGINLVLDDFGTGYSSLGYLQWTNFSTIKIDRTFVKSATGGSSESLAIIRAIVTMAEELGMETTAEGIETQEDMQIMQDLGCSRLQGYYFSKPVQAPSDKTASQTIQPDDVIAICSATASDASEDQKPDRKTA